MSAEPQKPESIRRMVRGSTLLLVGRLVSKLGNFVTQILIVRYLSQHSYGGFAYALSLVALAQSVVTLGLDRGIVRFLPIYHERGDSRRLLGTIVMTLLVIATMSLAAVALLFGAHGLAGRWIHDRQALTLLSILIFLAPLQALDDLLVAILAVFTKPRSIFFRKHVIAPGLTLLVVAFLILTRSDVLFLAFGYLLASAIGMAVSCFWAIRLLHEQGVFHGATLRTSVLPWREVFAFTMPLLTTELVGISMNTVNVFLLQHFWSTTSVAGLRAVQPTAKLNELVMASFATLFTPTAARMFASGDGRGINELYWRTAIWIAILSFPVFVLTFSLAQPITSMLYGARYSGSAPILAMLSLGYYFNAALGFNGLTLKVFGRVRYLIVISVVTVAVSIALSVLLIPKFGPVGAGAGIMVALVVHNLLKQAGLRLETGIRLFDARFVRIYAGIVVSAVTVLAIQMLHILPIYATVGLAVVCSVVLVRLNRDSLEVGDMFPEAMRLPLVRLLMTWRFRGEAVSRRGA